MKSTSRFLLATAIIAAVVVVPRTVNTCAPEFPETIFTRHGGPDRPLKEFAAGKVGIALPSWQRAYLTVAYRYYEGRPLQKSEQRSFMEFWDHQGEVDRPVDLQPLQEWLDERAKYKKTSPPAYLSQFKSSGFANVIDCLPPAFRTAAATLRDRAGKYGVESTELSEWIAGQDTVFQNCTEEGGTIPSLLPVRANPMLRADRAYQIAAADFYRGDLEGARSKFEQIAADRSSPWKGFAPYMVARTWIRQAEQSAPQSVDYDTETLKSAEPVLRAIIKDPQQRSMHQDARRLLGLVRYHAYPRQRLHELAALLSGDQSRENFGQYLRDYTMLLNRTLDEDPDFPGVERWGPKYNRLKKEWKLKQYVRLKQERADDLGDWLITFQSNSAVAKEHALARWRERKTIPWLALAISKAAGADEAASELMIAAAVLPPSSSAYATLAYHRARLAREQGNFTAARQTLADVLGHRADLPLSAVNLFEDESSQVADSVDTFTAIVGRSPVEVTLECDGWEGGIEKICSQYYYGRDKKEGRSPLPQIDVTTALIFNTKLPVDLYAQIAQSNVLPGNIRRQILPTAWVRAALLGKPGAAAGVAKSAVEVEPRLKRYAEDYSRAQTEQEREFVAVFAVLHFPGIRPFVGSTFARLAEDTQIDVYRDNWWCTDVGGNPAEINYYKQDPSMERFWEPRNAAPVDSPAYLTAEQRQQAADEWKQLHAMGIAQRYLPRVVLAWARLHPEDPRVPEALHYAERAVHLGCDDGKENRYGRDVFRLLHQKYPNSEWAKKTRVWY